MADASQPLVASSTSPGADGGDGIARSELDSWRRWRVGPLPTMYYIPDFVSNAEEESLVSHIYAAPKPKWVQLKQRRLQNYGGLPTQKGMIAEPMPSWLSELISKIERQCDGFFPASPNHVLINEYLPGQGIMPHEDGPYYQPFVAIVSLESPLVIDVFKKRPDEEHATLTESVMANVEQEDLVHEHEPGAAAADATTTSDTAGVSSSGKPAVPPRELLCSVLLAPRSLWLWTDEVYQRHLHGIAYRHVDLVHDKVVNLSHCPGLSPGDSITRQRRLSLTLRIVTRVTKRPVLLRLR